MDIGEYLGLPKEALFDLVSLAILHDNGASEKILHDKLDRKNRTALHSIEIKREHGIIGEKNIVAYPFLTSVNDAIKYHHENYG